MKDAGRESIAGNSSHLAGVRGRWAVVRHPRRKVAAIVEGSLADADARAAQLQRSTSEEHRVFPLMTLGELHASTARDSER